MKKKVIKGSKKGTKKGTKEKKLFMIVKRKGHKEVYDEKKVYGSCYFACRNAHLNEKESESISENVSKSITKWISKQKIVSSDDIFRALIEELKKYNEDASFLYETHRDIS